MALEYIDRPPRIQPELPVKEVEIPNPPEQNKTPGQGLMTSILPLITMVGFIFASGTGQIFFILPMGIAMVLSIAAAIYGQWKEREELKKKQKKYRELLAEMRQDMTREHNTQRIFYRHNFPDIPTVLEIAGRTETSRFGSRLWERRSADADFGMLRLGMGSRPSTVVYKMSQGADPLEEDLLRKDGMQLAADSAILNDAPITIPLRPNQKDSPSTHDNAESNGEGNANTAKPSTSNTSAQHAIGIFGKNATNTADFARAMLANFAGFHSAQDSRMVVVGNPHAQKGWQWCEWLPHCIVRGIGDDDDIDPNRPKQFEQLCFSDEKDRVSAFWKRIKKELDQRQVRLRETKDDDNGKTDVSLPLLLVVVDLLGETAATSPLKNVATEAVVATINSNGPTLGAAIIFLANDPSQIPSECKAMIEVASVGPKTIFRYTEIGLNTPRFLGEADLLDPAAAREEFAAKIRRLELPRPFGSDLPRAADMLQMQSVVAQRRIDTVDKLGMRENWARSIVPKNSEWLSVPIGMISMRDVRHMIFSAKEGGDGVHGMIAGTTGSGKSELLMTLIAGMAIRYDPRIVNFVLVDYKGGAAFEPFRHLPHTVDILTNLQANAVERMFVAVQAVMDKRSSLLAKSGVSDLVKYRQEVAPRLNADDPRPRTFPHLFIIVDEFAEMITANPDYRAKFESITRLGRAFGVSLLLATQRPAGVVTDQMRANMKFRICLRVETPDDSKELLGSPEASFLPNLGGRGYVQSGNDIMQGVQVAWAGADYSDDRKVSLPDVIWLDEVSKDFIKNSNSADAPEFAITEVAEALMMKPGELPKALLDWIVGVAALRAQRDGVPPQKKPWPNPLPEHLSLTDPIDAGYLNTERPLEANKTLTINHEIDAWLNNTEEVALWAAFDWKAPPPMRVDIGLIDSPYGAEQRLLTLDISRDPIVLFGASGRGKSSFIKTLLTAMAAVRSPNELHMYALDFGRGGLKSISALPHLGGVYDAAQADKVDGLLRMLRNFANERQDRLQKYANLADHNAKNPFNILAEIVIIIENFAEFKESYEHLIPDLMALIRDGRAFGIYFVLTATTPNDLTSKLLNLLTQRMTLSQADPFMYPEIVGSGARNFDNVPGRGLLPVAIKDGDKPMPLEFHIGMPGTPDIAVSDDYIDVFQIIAQRMESAWTKKGGKRPSAELPKAVTLLDMFQLIDGKPIASIGDLDITGKWQRSMQPENMEWLRGAIGLIGSKEVRTMVFQAQADGVHGMAAGTTGSGKSELLQTLISAMAIRYDPRIVNFVLVDYKGGPTVEPFRKLPHCVDIATNLEGNKVERIFVAINAEMNRRSDILARAGVPDLVEYRKKVLPTLKPGSPFPETFPHLFIVVDEFAEMITNNPDYKAKFESITRLGRSFGVSLILATQRPAGVVTDQMRSNMKFRICLRVETPEDSKELLKRPDAARLPQIGGRGYVQAGSDALTEVQAAWSGAPYDERRPDPVYNADEILNALDKHNDPPRSLLGWLVGAMAAEAIKQNIPKQFKPWPDSLPEQLSLNEPVDADYLSEVKSDQVIINPSIKTWLDAGDTSTATLWPSWDWQRPLPMRTSIGIVDDPFHSNQHLLTLDLASDPMVIFGASGRGKTTFVKSLLFGLAAACSPADLNIYALDFGRGGLKSVRQLPHCGATIDASQPDRVEALFRLIRGIMNERQDRLQKFASVEDYNLQQVEKHREFRQANPPADALDRQRAGTPADTPETLFPAIVIVVDNFAEFKESYEYLMPDLMALVRDGRQFGIFFVITASQTNDISAKLYNLLTQRLTFTLPDASAYIDIVGRGALSLENKPGRGLVNIEGQPLEFHTAVPVLEKEKDPYTRIAERMEKAWLAAGGKRPSAEIPKAITLLEMYKDVLGRKVDRLGDLGITEYWKRSMEPANQEWLSAPIGYISSKEIRTLVFSAKPGGDGVHGMGAGTTGSGKSELLQTLISSLAIKYDPRIINFVLIDYKGGPTVEPFRKLPHCVDIATNLEGNKVERIFTAINAEMNRRSEILAKAGVADLVEYRKKVIPSLRPDSPFPRTFPHLFVIVDEFAEMITNNPDYKAKFESITRLGRSFGVTLILATQRPSGSVTDQMRANMKFKLCLRVETADDSKEMIGRGDAASLPAIPGRGYVQVGGGSMNEFQAAYSGASYDETRPDPVYKVDDILSALDKQDDPPRSLLGWLVGALAAESHKQKIEKQFKPWPDPLPTVLPLNEPVNAEYIQKGRLGKEITINPAVAAWLALSDVNAGALPWKPHNWAEPLPVKAALGIIDNPYLSEQRLLTIDLSADPMLILGASGRGKSAFLKSLMVALAAQRSPDELHMYVLDFARGGLKALRNLPHVGGIVDASEDERVERLMRIIRNTIDERQQKLAAYDSLDDYNAKNPASPFPAVLVVIDNVSEFKEAYEKYLLDLITLVRDGRAFGVYFIITGTLVVDTPSKLFNIITQRITFTQSDGDYTSIVGRGWTRFNDEPGRGLTVELVDEQPVPLEFHTGVPVDMTLYAKLMREAELSEEADERKRMALMTKAADATFRTLSEKMALAWRRLERDDPTLASKRAKTVTPLDKQIDLGDLLPALGAGPVKLQVPVGINDLDREPTFIEFTAKGPHLMVVGPPVTGKTTAIRTLVLALAHSYSPEQVAMIFVDPSDTARRFFNYGANNDDALDKLPHVLATVSNAKEFDDMAQRLRAEYDDEVIGRLRDKPDVYQAQDNARRSIFLIIDHYDDIEGMLRNSKVGMDALAEIGKGKNLNIVVGGVLSSSGMMDNLRKRAEGSRYTLVLQDVERVRYMGVRGNFSVSKELPPGRGFWVKAVSAGLTQIALPCIDGKDNLSGEERLAELFNAIRNQYSPDGQKALWSYFAQDMAGLETAIKGEVAAEAASADNNGTEATATPSAESLESPDLAALMAQLSGLQSAFTPIAEAGEFASVTIEVPDEDAEKTPEA